MRIIHLEDEEIIAEFVAILCNGHEYVWAQNSDDAISRVKGESFDMAVIDLGLRGGDSGLCFLEWLVEHRPDVHRVLASGVVTSNMEGARDMAHASVDKPFTASQFRACLEEAKQQRAANGAGGAGGLAPTTENG